MADGIVAAIRAGEESVRTNAPRSNPYAIFPQMQARAVERNRKRPMYRGHAVSPAAIHAQAAKQAVEQKRLELEERRVALQEAQEERAAQEAALQRASEERQATFERGRAIDQDLEAKLQGSEERYQTRMKGIREQETFDRAKELSARKDAFGGVMLAIQGKHGPAVADFINQYGNPKARVANVEFATPEMDPKNPDGVIISYEDGTSSFFKDREALYKGFVGWMDPKLEETIYNRRVAEEKEARTKAKEARETAEFLGQKPLSKKQLADLRADALEEYREQYYDKVGKEWNPERPPQDQFIKQYIGNVTGATAAQAAEQKGAPGEQKAPPAEQPEEKRPYFDYGSGEGETGWTRDYKEYRAKDGRVKREYANGAIEVYDAKGNLLAAKDAQGNITKGGKGEAAETGKEKKVQGTAEYRDPKTGTKMKAIMYTDGTIERKPAEGSKGSKSSKEDKGDKKGKKKKKKDRA